MNTVKIKANTTRMVAHRGLSGIERENTCAAFVAAGNRSYFGIETDVHVTADGQYVVIHDDTTDRVGIDHLTVEETTAATLRSLQLTERQSEQRVRSDLHIPTLSEYILCCKTYEKVCVLELKNIITPEHIAGIVEEIKAMDYLEQVVFISFELSNLIVLRTLLPTQPIQYLTVDVSEKNRQALRQYHMDLDVLYTALDKETIDSLHAEGIAVNCWTVDDPAVAEMLVGWGIDYITTNILEGTAR